MAEDVGPVDGRGGDEDLEEEGMLPGQGDELPEGVAVGGIASYEVLADTVGDWCLVLVKVGGRG